MPRINLLPVRAERRRGSAKQELYAMLGIIVITLGGLYLWYNSVESGMSDLRNKLDGVRRDITGFEQDVKKVKSLESQTKSVEQKRGVIAALEKKRTGPAKMLDDLATILTQEKKVWLVDLKEHKGKLTLTGQAMEHENISEFVIALSRRSTYFKNVTLVGVKAVQGARIPILEWRITCATDYAAG